MGSIGRLAGAGLIALCAAGAHATTYQLALAGTVEHQLDCWENLALCDPSLPPVINPPVVDFPWTGVVTLVVDSAANGTFTGAGIVSLSLASSLGLASFDATSDGLAFFSHGKTQDAAAIVNGRVASIDLSFFDPELQDITFSGLGVEFRRVHTTHLGPFDAQGALVNVPEPGAYAMLLLGLLGLSGYSRNHRRARRLIRRRRGHQRSLPGRVIAAQRG